MSKDAVIQFLHHISEREQGTMYRGQLNWRWSLVPSIARYSKYVSDGYGALAHAEEHLIEEFIKASVPHIDLRSMSMIERLVHAQHYGLPTRLLDWSTNPLKALFFAVENPDYDNFDGVVHIYQPSSWYEGTQQIRSMKGLTAFYPELLNERIAAQDACFTAFELPERGMRVKPLTASNYSKDIYFLGSYRVPKSSKKTLRFQLAALGINHRTIMPGLDGVARWVKSNLSGYAV